MELSGWSLVGGEFNCRSRGFQVQMHPHTFAWDPSVLLNELIVIVIVMINNVLQIRLHGNVPLRSCKRTEASHTGRDGVVLATAVTRRWRPSCVSCPPPRTCSCRPEPSSSIPALSEVHYHSAELSLSLSLSLSVSLCVSLSVSLFVSLCLCLSHSGFIPRMRPQGLAACVLPDRSKRSPN